MIGTDLFLWIGIADHYPFPDPDPQSVIRSFADPDPHLRTRSRSGSDRQSMIAILPITGYKLLLLFGYRASSTASAATCYWVYLSKCNMLNLTPTCY